METLLSRRFLVRSLLIVATLGGATACTSASAVRTGAVAYPPLPANAPVEVFFDERAVGRPFEVVGEVAVDNPGKYQVLTVNDAIPTLQVEARKIGANGVIIDAAVPVKSGIVSTGVNAHGRAIRIAPGVPATGAPAPVPPQTATVVVPAR